MPRVTKSTDKRLKANRPVKGASLEDATVEEMTQPQDEVINKPSTVEKPVGMQKIGKAYDGNVPRETQGAKMPQAKKLVDNGAQMPQNVIVRERPKRPTRSADVLNAPQRPGYVRRFVNDKPGRVQRMIEMGYTIVTKPTETGNQRAGEATPQSKSTVSRHVGGNVTAYLMEIPEDWYDAYKAEEQAELDEQGKSANVVANVATNAGDAGTDSTGMPMAYGKVENK